MKEWRLQPHRWCLLGHYPAWMCLDVTNFAIILPLNSVPEKKTHLFASENSQKCEKNQVPSTEMREKQGTFFRGNPSKLPYVCIKFDPCQKGVPFNHHCSPCMWMPVGNEWCISPAGPPRHFSIPRIHSRPFTGENPTSSFRASRLLTYPGYSKFAPETIPVIPKTSRIIWTNHPFFRAFAVNFRDGKYSST